METGVMNLEMPALTNVEASEAGPKFCNAKKSPMLLLSSERRVQGSPRKTHGEPA